MSGFREVGLEEQLARYRSEPPRRHSIGQGDAAELACRILHARGVQPSPGRVQEVLGMRVTHDLNGAMSKAYAWTMEDLGYVRRTGKTFGARWTKP